MAPGRVKCEAFDLNLDLCPDCVPQTSEANQASGPGSGDLNLLVAEAEGTEGRYTPLAERVLGRRPKVRDSVRANGADEVSD